MRLIVNDIECSVISNEIMSLWLEYEDGGSPESLLAHQLDKFEMIVQAGNLYKEHDYFAITIILFYFTIFLIFIVIYFSLFFLYFLADEYEKSQAKQLDRFFLSTADSFTHPEVSKRESERAGYRDRMEESWIQRDV